ncbi:glycosyltransferase family 39 protein [Curtobacterium sp. VKM Ac-2884]|uniref:glycosyltransferase family 39 protein n=1 Tax=Curtobacterium sp. VKM Ac-2884 TaxID=2783818 RepID=UPI00188A2397|nr:hypothetical protein [Curtobacterium sp. VKM Ac-2884]
MTAVAERSVVPVRSTRARPVRLWVVPTLVGVGTTSVAAAFSWVPSVWYDEAATVVSATRPWAALAREVQHVDVVHATYYAVMHCWFALVGYTPFTLRLPSAFAIGVAAALLVVLGRTLASPRTGLIAGVLFALFPRVTWMGSEGRSFAIDTALAVGATILFVAARDRTRQGARSWPWWVVYTAISILSGAVFLYLALVTVGHGVTAGIPLLRRSGRDRDSRKVLLSWVAATALSACALLPLATASAGQDRQIAWINPISAHTIQEVLMTQWFTKNPGFAVFGCALAVAGVVLMRRNDTGRRLLVVALPWALVPTVGLIAASLVTNPLYSPRYAAFTAPAVALCMGAALTAVPTQYARRAIATATIVAAVLTAPTWVQQRTVAAKDDAAWNEAAAVIAAHRTQEPAGQEDAVVFGPLERHPLTTSRIIAETYPAAFSGLRDPLLVVPASKSAGLWETQRPLPNISNEVGAAKVVWLLTAVKPDVRTIVTQALAHAGYQQRHTWQRTRTWIVQYQR